MSLTLRTGVSAVDRRAGHRRWVAGLLACLALTCMASPVRAQSCYVSGALGLNFGTVSSSGKAASATVTYTCAPDYSALGNTFYYELCLYIGPGDWSVGESSRRMSDYNGNFLRYDLFSDPAHTQIIGVPGTPPVYRLAAVIAPGSPQTATAPIHGWLYPGQSVPARHGYQEQGLQGLLRYRYGVNAVPSSEDCATGGLGGGSVLFRSSGVLARFENGCWIGAGDLDFGQVPPPTQAIDASSSIRLQCPAGTAWRLELDNGLHYGGGSRRMAGTGGVVAYGLYLDAGRTRPWGAGPDDAASGTIDAAGGEFNLTVYGQVPAQPGIAPGFYKDTVVATLYY